MPVFIRVAETVDLTSTFKHNKTRLQEQAFVPDRMGNDVLFVRDDAARTYLPLTEGVYNDILNKKRRL